MRSLPSFLPMRIATRGSALALTQAGMVLEACQKAFPNEAFRLKIIKTTGDKLQKASLRNPASNLPKGLFTKELEIALLEGHAEFAVHSLKDLPTDLPDGLRLGAVLPRADVRDILVTRVGPGGVPAGAGLGELPTGSVIATSSTRRAAQVRACRPDLRTVEIRGNVTTRLLKLATHMEIHGTLLAAAGLARLGILIEPDGRLGAPPYPAPEGWGALLQATILPLDVMLPAPGQAAIGIECRRGDRRAARVCRALEDATTRVCVEAERAFLRAFGGGCNSPVAALGRLEAGDRLRLSVLAFDQGRVWQQVAVGEVKRSRQLGARLGRAARADLLGLE